MKIVLEGTDLIGKTTQKNILKDLGYDVEDRKKEIYSYINFDLSEKAIMKNITEELNKSNYLLIVMYVSIDQILETRIKERGNKCDLFDLQAVKYNKLYYKIFSKIKHKNLYLLKVDSKNIKEVTDEIIKIIKRM